MWWKGSNFLFENTNFSSQCTFPIYDGNLLLTKATTCVAISENKHKISNIIDINNYSSLKRLYRVTACVCRLKSDLIKKKNKQEIELSLLILICPLNTLFLFMMEICY